MNDDSKPIWQSRTVLASIASLLAGLFMLFGIEVSQDELTEALVLLTAGRWPAPRATRVAFSSLRRRTGEGRDRCAIVKESIRSARAAELCCSRPRQMR